MKMTMRLEQDYISMLLFVVQRSILKCSNAWEYRKA